MSDLVADARARAREKQLDRGVSGRFRPVGLNGSDAVHVDDELAEKAGGKDDGMRAKRADAGLEDLRTTLWLRGMLGGSYSRVVDALELWYEANGGAAPLRAALVAARVLALIVVDGLPLSQVALELGCSKRTVIRRVADLTTTFPPLAEVMDARRKCAGEAVSPIAASVVV